MKRLKLIYNPVSGNALFKNELDRIVERFQKNGCEIVPYKLMGKDDAINAFKNFKEDEFYGIVACGGDGTVHDVVNAMKEKEIGLPLGVIPSGTSNDFANYLGLPKNIDECIDIISLKNNPQYVDIGRINNKYFINIVAGGILTSIAHKANRDLKNYIGMLAYYLEALEEIPNIKPFEINIFSDNVSVSENILMFIVLNTSIAGGFKVVPTALVDDGKFDVFLIKNCKIGEFGMLFLKLLRGDHIDDSSVMYFQAKELTIHCNSGVETDIDGEAGEKFPLEIKVLPQCLRVFK